MTLRLGLRIDGENDGAERALGETERGLTGVDQATKKTTASTNAFAAALGQEVAALNRQHQAAQQTIADLRFEGDQLKRNSEQRAVHDAARRAGVSVISAEGREIAKVVTENERLRASQQKAAQAVVDKDRAAAQHRQVADALRFEADQLKRNSEQRAVHDALRRAGVSAASAEGRAIAQAAAANERLRDARQRAARASLANNDSIEKLARIASVAGGSVGGLVGQAGGLFIGMSRLGGVVTAATLVLGLLAVAAGGATAAYAKLETQQARTANIIAVTNGAANRSVADLARGSGAAARIGTQTIDDIRAAQAELLRYREVSGTTFDRALTAAQALANLGYVPLKEAAAALGQAIKDPIEGLQGLEAAGLRFTARQREVIRRLVETGDSAKASGEILRIAEQQLAGVNTRGADTLGAAYGRLTNAGQLLLESWGKQVADGLRLKDVMNAVATASERAARSRWTSPYSFAFGVTQMAMGVEPTAVAPPPEPRSPLASAQDYYSRGGTVVTSRGRIAPQSVAAADTSGFEDLQKRIRISSEAAEKIDTVTIALDREREAARLNEVEQAQLNARRQAGVDQLNGENVVIAERAKRSNELVAAIQRERAMTQARAQFIVQSSALRVEAETLHMTTAAATAYRYEQEKIAEWQARGIPLTRESTEEWRRQGETLGALAQRAEGLRNLYSVGTELVTGIGRDLKQSIRDGASAWDAFKNAGLNALDRIIDKLVDIAAQNYIKQAFGGMDTGGGLGGLLTSIFGGAKAASGAAINVVGAAGGLPVPTFFDRGGYTGAGGRHEAAGIVHRGEFVFDAPTTARHRSLFETIHRGGRVPGFAGGGYVGPFIPPPPPSAGALARDGRPAAPPVVNVYPAAAGETFDVRQNPGGSLDIVGRMIEGALDAFKRQELPTLVHNIAADPRRR